MKEKPTIPDWVMMGGGIVCLLFSFLAFYKFGSVSRSAWGTGLFPLATYVALFGLIIGGSAALRVFAGTKLPEPIIGFTWKVMLVSRNAEKLMLGYLLVDKGGLSFGIGFWLMLLGAIALVAGAVMETIGFDPQAAKGGGAAPGATPPAPPPPPSSPPPPPPSA